MASHLRVSRQWVRRRWLVLALLALMSVMISTTGLSPATAQQGGLGVGRGHGLEVGINLPALNQIRAEIAQGVYTRPCTDEEHDRHRWHTLVDPVRKCYYDHHHGDDPNYVNDIFGEPGAWYGVPGQSVSYPWQTFPAAHAYESNDRYVAEGRMENDQKHEGYIWIVRRDQPCPDANCVTDFRLQVHSIMGAHDMPVRYHSYSFEGRVCLNPNNPSTCGIVRNAGWADFGRLFTTEPNVIDCGHNVRDIPIPLPADALYFPLDRPEARDEIRCHPNIVNLPQYPSQRPLAEWWAHSPSDFVRFQLRSYDPIGNVRPENPAEWHFHCTPDDPNCKYNMTIMSVFIGYVLHIREFITLTPEVRVDSNFDGRADYRGFGDRWGNYRADCTVTSLDCVPVVYESVPLNLDYNGDGRPEEARYFHHPCDNCQRVDYDLSPPGQSWNNWFFTKYTDHQPAPPVEPTPAPEGPAVVVNINNPSPSVGESVIVALELHNVSGVYGLQAECVVNPVVLAGTERIDGSGFNSGNSFFVDTGFNPGNGHWLVAASRLAGDGQPAEGISGNATAFMLAYDVISGGDSQVNCAVLVVDANGSTIDVEVINGSLISETPTDPTPPPTPMPLPPTPDPEPQPEPDEPSRITGATQYQNRVSNDGIQVELVDTSTGSLVEAVAAGADGAYSFDAVPVGSYEMVISAPQHIPVVYPVEVAADGTLITMEPSVLRAGDVDNNGRVDIIDATFVGANFGLDAMPEIAHIDLNGDGVINITDLVLVGSNFGLTSPLTQ